ncbi:MAG: hypothetical protein ACREH8_01360 [Opitutaceae bacterium]
MLTLAALRYRNVLAAHGGPIARIESGEFPVRGRRVVLANARLVPGLVRKGPLALFSDADGTGTHRVPSVARHKAVSEAMERWAFHSMVCSERAAEFGFDIDPSTTGMSAFPGLLRRQARRSAVLEAVERFSLMAWWEGRVDGRRFETDWPGVSAVAIDGPFGGMTVIVYARTDWGGYIYGHAAEESFGAACDRAVEELARNEWVLRSSCLATAAGNKVVPTNVFERRCLFFATDEGHELFRERMATRASAPAPRAEIICDRDIPGPWDQYATVWRFALRPPSDGFLRGGERYFFL